MTPSRTFHGTCITSRGHQLPSFHDIYEDQIICPWACTKNDEKKTKPYMWLDPENFSVSDGPLY